MYNLTPKVYDIDYSFIVKNYLSPSLWEKEWTLYIYKDLEFSVLLDGINCQDSAIRFKIRIKNPQDGYSNSTFIYHYIKTSNITVLKRQINGAMYELMCGYERHVIRKSEEFEELMNMYADEDDNLETIAEEFLYENGVTNKDIRDVYIESYVSNNRKRYTAESNYMDAKKFLILPDYFLTLTKVAGDDSRYNVCYAKISKNIDTTIIEKLMEEAKEVYEFGDEYTEDMKLQLEAI